MFDRETESLWSHILGQGVGGEFAGTHLEFIPVLNTDWQTWKARHPETLVVSPGLYGSDPYASYYAGGREGVVGRGAISGGGPHRGDDIHPKEYVIGLRLAGEAKAYPFSVLGREPLVNDEVGNIPVAVFFNKSTLSGTAFDRRLDDDRILTFEGTSNPAIVRDTKTQSEWDTITGVATRGELEGTQLAEVPFTYSFWFGWIDYHTDSKVYGVER